jgi:tripartite-type tricarboxylate transporter receptor subunit TctC
MRWIATIALVLLGFLFFGSAPGRAEDYPAHPIRLIVGFPPGSAADITARLVGEDMSKSLGQQVVIETRPGAGSSIAGEYAAHAPADGYTLYIGTSSNVSDAVTNPNLRFDFSKDFAPITLLTGLPLVLAVNPSLGVSSFDQLIALARAKPGQLTYASVGVGTVPQLACELISIREHIKLVHVPYPGSPPAVTDLLAGRVSMMLGVASTIMPYVKSGRLKAFAVSTAKRSRLVPDLPTIEELGVPDFDATVWFGLMAPAATPRPIIDKLAAAANAALKSPQTIANLETAQFEPLGGSPGDFAAFIARETAKWRMVAEATGLKK